MNERDQRAWQDEVLDHIFEALVCDTQIVNILVFKGARVLALQIPEAARQSLDLDANLREEFIAKFPRREEQAEELQRLLQPAIERYFEGMNPVRFTLQSARIECRPPKKDHPRGWNALEARIQVVDAARPGGRNLPTLTLDIAAPEKLSARSTTTIRVGASEAVAYTLERIAGEKLRAFLSTTPVHQKKKPAPRNEDALRVKDIFDVVGILRKVPLSNDDFWRAAAQEFRDACESRGVSCEGWRTFEEVESLARAVYERDATVARLGEFDGAWEGAERIIRRFEQYGVVPCEFTLSPLNSDDNANSQSG